MIYFYFSPWLLMWKQRKISVPSHFKHYLALQFCIVSPRYIKWAMNMFYSFLKKWSLVSFYLH